MIQGRSHRSQSLQYRLHVLVDPDGRTWAARRALASLWSCALSGGNSRVTFSSHTARNALNLLNFAT